MTDRTFKTRSLSVAIFLVAAGSPFPSLLEERTGNFDFAFDDPEGTVRRSADELDLRDTESEKCCVPASRLFMAQKMLKDAIAEARGGKR
jgi:hypothetical protein